MLSNGETHTSVNGTKPKILAVQRFLPQLGVQRKGLAQLSFVCPFAKIARNGYAAAHPPGCGPPHEFTAEL